MGDLPAPFKFFISNLQSFITLKLDSSNYLAWRVQVETALSANNLLDLLLNDNISETEDQSDGMKIIMILESISLTNSFCHV